MSYNDNMNTNKTSHTKKGPVTVKVISDLSDANIQKVVVVAPDGHTEAFDNRVYQCLAKGCGNRGSVNSGHFTRKGKDTVCHCGSDFNRWIREAAV